MSDDDLIQAAVTARQAAYAPYSGFRVGAAVALAKGQILTGVNVENCSYGLTVCAERNAIAAAVAAGAAPGDVVAVAIAADAAQPTPPCGACRQVVTELAADPCRILIHNLRDGSTTQLELADLLPSAFTRSSMPTR